MITKTTIVKRIVQIVCVVLVGIAYNDLINTLPVAVKINEYVVLIQIKNDLADLNAPQNDIVELSNAIYASHQSTGIHPKLITALMYTESNFNKKAIGPENWTGIRYKGLMQTPTATYYSDVDTLHGSRILKEKLSMANHDLRTALAMYKGGKNPMAFKQADEVLTVFRRLQM